MEKKLLPINQNNSSPLPRKRFALLGKVLRVDFNKTIVVQVTKKVRHPLYQKVITKDKKYLVHDQTNLARVNDRVKIISSRKFSKKKTFTLVKVLKTFTASEKSK